MSRFVETLVASARRNSGEGARGLTTGEPEEPRFRTWAQVHEDALQMAGGLGDQLRPGAAVAVLAADPGLIGPAVQAVWLGGGSVTMLHQPTPRTDLDHWAEDTLKVLKMIGARLVLLGPPFEQLGGVLEENGIAYRDLAGLAVSDAEPLPGPVEVGEDETALLQLTSGSTAEPKAVRITHRNLNANLQAMVTAAELDPERDLAMSWLPLFHDMGMVGCLTVPMAIGMSTVKVTPSDFLASPLLWPKLISKYRATVTAAPNFAYAVVGRRLARADEDFDLSSLRFTLNGAEPIDPAAAQAFTDAGARFGMDPNCMVCAFGMAEATLAVSFAPLGRGVETDSVDAEGLERRHVAEPVDPDTAQARRFALLGHPLPGLEVDVVDDEGTVLADRQVGRLRIRGEAVTPGYLTVDGPLEVQDADGWLDTGDEGYLTDGQVVICGRRKDVIIMGGRNIYPVDIERAACEVQGVRPGNAAAVRLEAGSRRERFAVVLESKLAGSEDEEKALRKAVVSRIVDAVGVRPAEVVVLPPGTLPKTPSGKLRRAATADLVPPR
ncbi:long-chain fatty acid--CoA ligase [Saccharopolyspora rhizosphaerae]|uniref:Long-chain fatty acid--CoA ligase n=1 Tax=Saccharopolyspora rhizosphaerae TaxID=2492662 RepID=A0A3R8QM75_9PSEU|nr:fatty acyl-AMP ligase [Saccharopolyspora rhizosphaerae]RRO15481.1 long-chain fatty acid--CoA ligase [Saccharopolyspora rhizosphaerae]